MYKRIAVAADGSAHSIRAAQEAVKIAKNTPDTHVSLLYVVNEDKTRTDRSTTPSQQYSTKLKPIEDIFLAENIPYEVKVLYGIPGPAIAEHVNDSGYDLLFIGSRGLNALQEMVLGSVSHKVIKRAQAPVVVVK